MLPQARRLFVGLIGVTLIWMSGTAVNAGSSWDEVIAAAKKEGSVTIYSGIPGNQEIRAIAKEFQVAYGIKVNLLEGVATEIAERARTEAVMDKAVGDIHFSGLVAQYTLKKANVLDAPGDLPNRGKLGVAPGFDGDTPIYMNAWGMLVNTRLVPPDSEPTSWRDLLDARWKRKIISADPTLPGSGNIFVSVMGATFGIDYITKLAAQDLTFSQDQKVVQRRVAQGEFPLYVNFTITDINRMVGLPVKAIVPKEGLYYLPMSMNVLRKAPHPNAARLFINYALEPDSQLTFARAGQNMSVKGLESRIPEDKRWSADAKLLGGFVLEGYEERLRESASIFRK